MRKWIQNLSNKQELILILVLIFGTALISSTYEFIQMSIFKNGTTESIDTLDLGLNSIFQISLILVALIIFKIRKIDIKSFNFQFQLSNIPTGLILFLAVVLTTFIIGSGIIALNPDTLFAETKPNCNLAILPIFLIINSFYEEFFLNNYIFSRLSHWRPDQILSFSVILRASYHTYQGLYGFILLIFFGLIFTGYYSKTRKLWPLVIAHTLFNCLTFYIAAYYPK